MATGLSRKQQDQLQALMAEFPSVFLTTPGCTTVIEHKINVGDGTPIHQRPYRLPYSNREIVKEDFKNMIAAGVVQPSTSPWASPIVLVKKKGGGTQFYRLSQVTKFDAYMRKCLKALVPLKLSLPLI